jgi:hypothetical protein
MTSSKPEEMTSGKPEAKPKRARRKTSAKPRVKMGGSAFPAGRDALAENDAGKLTKIATAFEEKHERCPCHECRGDERPEVADDAIVRWEFVDKSGLVHAWCLRPSSLRDRYLHLFHSAGLVLTRGCVLSRTYRGVLQIEASAASLR